MYELELVDTLIADTRRLTWGDNLREGRRAYLAKLERAIVKLFGPRSPYLARVRNVSLEPQWPFADDVKHEIVAVKRGTEELRRILKTMKDETLLRS